MNDLLSLMSWDWPSIAAGRSCSKMPGAEGIAFLIVAAYAACTLLVFLAAGFSAKLRSRKNPLRARRIWILHLAVALMLTAGPPLYLYGYGVIMTRASTEAWTREKAAFESWKAEIAFKPGQVGPMLDKAFAALPRDLRWNDSEWIATLQRDEFEAFEGSPAVEWRAADLDAFASFPARLERARNRPTGWRLGKNIPAIVAWDRDRSNLAAAAALCEDSDERVRTYCREGLRYTVRGWCAANRSRCDELEREPAFQQAAGELGAIRESAR